MSVAFNPAPDVDTTAEQRQLVRARINDQFVELYGMPPDDPRRVALRADLAGQHVGLAERLASRFRNRGESSEDLVQVAAVGLLKAIDGFDPGRGVDFSSYAIPTMLGEIKRHFRDKGWLVRVPRRLQELRLDIARITTTLTQELGRTPSNADLAERLGVTEQELRECQLATGGYSALSLSAPLGDEKADNTLADVVGGWDQGMQTVDDRACLRPLIRKLDPRERQILGLRFFDDMTQTQIAEHVGISQMHVSRLLARSLTRLREGMLLEV
ncbi:MAG: SigB/SigF/SigG family RNA polymerase sigma factor [Geodermatophilaceae bacterium]|nr:SigB/SigF/SigG family RNA polymerase sigma factor [Geodermatophilaceae bacterium]MDQ3454173.1 SigB/SigF/SigG family RNA polymerase sigma factor [Actinomycetota bacterium]